MDRDTAPLPPTPAEQRLARLMRPAPQPTDHILDWVLVRIIFFDCRPDRRR